jgi:hypothetical protein
LRGQNAARAVRRFAARQFRAELAPHRNETSLVEAIAMPRSDFNEFSPPYAPRAGVDWATGHCENLVWYGPGPTWENPYGIQCSSDAIHWHRCPDHYPPAKPVPTPTPVRPAPAPPPAKAQHHPTPPPAKAQPQPTAPLDLGEPRPPANIPDAKPAPPVTTGKGYALQGNEATPQAHPWISSNEAYWLGVALAIGASYFAFQRLHLCHASAVHAGREWLEKTLNDARAAREQAAQAAEFRHFERMSDKGFDKIIERYNRSIDQAATNIHRWNDTADRIEARRFHVPILDAWRINQLRTAADKASEDGHAVADEIERIKFLFAEVKAARTTKIRDKKAAEIRPAIGLVGSTNNATVEAALQKLRRYRDIDWLTLIPEELPEAARQQAAKILRLMCSTSINEARNCHARLRALFQTHNCPFSRLVGAQA